MSEVKSVSVKNSLKKAKKFVEWLNKKGVEAELGEVSQSFVNGVSEHQGGCNLDGFNALYKEFLGVKGGNIK